MKHLRLAAGIVLALVPASVHAQASTFDLFYEATENETQTNDLMPGLVDFVIREMEHWHTNGIVLTRADIDAALQGKLWAPDGSGLCQNKSSMNGVPYTFIVGGNDSAGACAGLLHDIESLINAEREISSLGTDLLGIAGGTEASIADEPGHAVDMAAMALVLRRVWSGTGSAVIPWDGSADGELQALDGSLSGLSEEELDKAIIRFRHGLFRDQRENDPRFSGIATQVETGLQDLANRLGITGNPRQVGVFAVPKLRQTKNVAVWIRKDDVGLLYVYPTHFPRFSIEQADEYPEISQTGSGTLAYPFEYTGSTPPSGPAIDSPLCSRMVGRQGYLCRPLSDPGENCPSPNASDRITLVKCDDKVFITQSGPRICPDFRKLFENDPNLTDPANPGELNPNLKLTNTGSICSPEKKVIYQDDIESHACYIGFCLLQSMTGHTLIPNRSPAVINEATSPYLACIRPDPQLGLYTEFVENSPYPVPEYLGTFLGRDFQRQYGATTGNAPQPLPGFCQYDDNLNAALPLNLFSANEQHALEESRSVQYRQEMMNLVAGLAGQRASIDQSIELQRKVFAKLANFIQQTASLLLELKNAPLTKTACPWTGQFKSSTAP